MYSGGNTQSKRRDVVNFGVPTLVIGTLSNKKFNKYLHDILNQKIIKEINDLKTK